MGWSREQFDAYQTRRVRDRASPQFQEFQDAHAGPSDHRSQEAGVDGAVYPEFCITATICIADERDRDNDGAYSTLQDCLIAAVGRLAQMDPKTLRKHAAGFKRKRRGRARNPNP